MTGAGLTLLDGPDSAALTEALVTDDPGAADLAGAARRYACRCASLAVALGDAGSLHAMGAPEAIAACAGPAPFPIWDLWNLGGRMLAAAPRHAAPLASPSIAAYGTLLDPPQDAVTIVACDDDGRFLPLVSRPDSRASPLA